MQKLTLCLDNNCYNLTNQLAHTLQFLNHVDTYLQDANKAGNQEAEKAFQTIREDREKHAGMLKELLIREMQKQA